MKGLNIFTQSEEQVSAAAKSSGPVKFRPAR